MQNIQERDISLNILGTAESFVNSNSLVAPPIGVVNLDWPVGGSSGKEQIVTVQVREYRGKREIHGQTSYETYTEELLLRVSMQLLRELFFVLVVLRQRHVR